eukprot:355343-Chlamydomonas_euryale.AAC.3
MPNSVTVAPGHITLSLVPTPSATQLATQPMLPMLPMCTQTQPPLARPHPTPITLSSSSCICATSSSRSSVAKSDSCAASADCERSAWWAASSSACTRRSSDRSSAAERCARQTSRCSRVGPHTAESGWGF